MASAIIKISLTNFRNYSVFELDNLGSLNIFVGPNAAGKTNIIEAIQLMTEMSSFRHSQAIDMVNHELLQKEEDPNKTSNFARIEVNISENSVAPKTTFNLIVNNKGKSYKFNGKPKRIADLKGRFPSVTFTPDDLMLVKGGNSLRRNMIDALGSQLSANYYTVRKDYNKVLRQKNKLLKDEGSDVMLQSLNDVLVISGAQLCGFRVTLLQKLAPLISKFYDELSGGNEKLDIRYYLSWDNDCKQENQLDSKVNRDQIRKEFYGALEEKNAKEKQRCRSIIGPHSDKIEFYLDGKNASDFASQGQQRSIILALKLAQVQLIEDVLEKRPILLLDDVMSELDKSRRNQLIEFFSDDTQVFITTTNLEYFDDEVLEKATIFRIGQQ